MAGPIKNADIQNRGRNGQNRNREHARSTERANPASTLALKADQYYRQRPYSPHNFHNDPNIVYGVKTDAPPVQERLGLSTLPPVQTRLKIGQPGDKYEQEADAVADKVANAPSIQTKLPPGDPEGAGEPGGVQAKLSAPKPDLGENFAQRYYQARPYSPHNFHAAPELATPAPDLAKKASVQRQQEPEVQEKELQESTQEARKDDPGTAPPPETPGENSDVPALQQKCETCGGEMDPGPAVDSSDSGEAPAVQQKCAACAAEESVQASGMGGPGANGEVPPAGDPNALMLKGGDGVSYGTDALQSRLNSSKGGGDPLPEDTLTHMEDNIGADFGNVRVHTGGEAVQMNQELGAQAFTHGSDIYFNQGKYQPETSQGKHLLAHELTHTVQQGAAPPVQPKTEPLTTDHTLQREEEVEDEELKKQLEDSEEEREEAIDPLPAKQEEKQAEKPNEELLTGPESLATDEIGEAAQETEPGAEAEAPAAEAVAAEKAPKGGGGGGAPKKDPTLGTVGKEMEETSAQVCPDAEAKTSELAANETTHDSPEDKLAQTESAVEPPAEEGQAMGNAGQVETVEGNPEPNVSEQEAKAEMQAAITESIPSDVDDMNKFKSKGKGKVVSAKVLGKVNEDVDAVKGTYNEMEQTATPEPPSNVPQQLPETEVAPETPEMNLGEEAVPELTDEQTDMSGFENEADEQMKKEGITDEQLEMVDSGDLAEAKKERKGLKKKVKDTPGKLKAEAKEKARKVDQDAKAEEKKVKGEMRKKREGALAETKGKQEKTKSELEKKREAVTNHINGIYEKAKKSVTTKLENLEKVNKVAFKKGQDLATKTFENEVNRDVQKWKNKRYSGIFGGVKWLKDKLFGIADFPEIKNAFERARKRYIQNIDKLIAKINEANQKVIVECKQELADAKKQIKEYVDGLGPELKAAGQAAQKEMAKKLEELDGFVNKKQKELTEKLCKAKEQAIKDIDKKIEKMKSEMSGLLAMLGNLLLQALKKFFEWALTAVGKDPKPLLNLLDKGAAVLKALFGDPIGFVKNLIAGVKKGIDQFQANIKKHLISGLVGWLTGAMSEVSITLPGTWDLKGILYFIMQLLGLTWENLRAKLVKRLGKNGEKIVSMAETGVEIVQKVVKEGPIGLWNWVKEKAADIKAQVFAGIRNYVITSLVKKGIIKLVSMLNPAGAIVQAIIAIFDTVMFFVENWDSILDFVNSIFDSISNIAAGKIGAAANYIEQTMAKTIPIILNFLGKFIGLSGIGKAVQTTVKKIRKPVDNAMDKALDFMEKGARKLFGKKGGKGEKKSDGKYTKEDQSKAKKAVPTIEKQKSKDGKVSPEEANQTASSVKQKHPVVKTIKPVLNKDTYDYKMVFKKDETVTTPNPAEAAAGDVDKWINESHTTAKPVLEGRKETLIKNIKTNPSMENFRKKARASGTIKKFYDKPLDNHQFGNAVRGKVEDKLKAAGANAMGRIQDKTGEKYKNAEKLSKGGSATKESLKSRVFQIHQGQKHYKASLDLLRDLIFLNTQEGAMLAAIQTAFQNVLMGASSEHTEFKPVNLNTKVDDPKKGKSTLTYNYAGGTTKFKVIFDNSTKMPDQVTGEGLAYHSLGRGATKGKTFEFHNRAHIIANEIKGSGYVEAMNLKTTSANFNQETMVNAEKRLADKLGEINNLASFKLKVNVLYANPTVESKISMAEVKAAMKARHSQIASKTGPNDVAEAGNLATLMAMKDDELRKKLNVKIDEIGEPRVMNIKYTVESITLTNGTTKKPKPAIKDKTGSDKLYGA